MLRAFVLGLSLLVFASPPARADDALPADKGFSIRTLTGRVRTSHHFSSPVLKGTRINGATGLLIGGRGAVLYDHSFGIGGGGFTLVSGDGETTLSYGGPALNYIFFPESVVHFDVGLMAAWGRGGERLGEFRSIFLLEPEAHVEINVTGSIRIALGAGYRHVFERGRGQTSTSSALSGVTFMGALRFGNF